MSATPDAGPPFTRPDVQAFLAYLNNLPGPRTHEIGAPAARAAMRAMRDLTDLPRGELATVTELSIPGPAGSIPARLYDARATRARGPAVVFLHGGGFVFGDLDTHDGFTAEVARALDLPVIAVDYRLAPEHPWPAAPDDAEAAARWVAGSPAALGRQVTGLVLMGDSAGGALAIVAAMDLRDRPAAVPVLVHAPIYPPADMRGEHPSMAAFGENYLLSIDAMRWFDDAYAADLSQARGSPMEGNLAGMPPAAVLTAGLDPIRDQGRAYAAALARVGVPVTFREAAGNIHGFVNLRRAIPSSVGDVAGFLAALRVMIVEAEGTQAQAEGTTAG